MGRADRLVEADLQLHAGLGDPTDSAAAINDLANSFPGFSQARRPLGVLADVRTTFDTLINNPPAGAMSRSNGSFHTF